MSNRKSIKAAIARGHSLAEQTLKRRKVVARHRQATLRHLAQASGLAAAAAAPRAPTSAGVIVAEGDSWFDYPFHDVLKLLEDDHGYEVEAVSHKGDCVEDMAYSGGQMDDFSRRIEKVIRGGTRPKALLISGGGNDIAGDEFAILLNHAASGAPGLNESVLRGVIDQRLLDAYATILSATSRLCENLLGSRVPTVVHGYDYPVADGRGVAGGFWVLPGPWLEPGFVRKGYGSVAVRKAVMKSLIDRFNDMLATVCSQPDFRHVTHLDLRNTLSPGADYKQWWANELHPNAKGFKAVAAKFAAAIG